MSGCWKSFWGELDLWERSLKAEANPGVGAAMIGGKYICGGGQQKGQSQEARACLRVGWVPGMLWLEV